MNVTQYTHAGGSGAARYVANLSRALSMDGVAVTLLCPGDFQYVSDVEGAGVRVVHGPKSLAGARGRPTKLTRALHQSAAGGWLAVGLSSQCRLVHMNFVGIPTLILPVIWYLRVRGRVVVLTVHDVVPHRPILGSFLAPLERWSLRMLYRAVSNLVVLYSGALSELATDFGVQEARITVIPHGAEPVVLDRDREAESRQAIRLAVLGSLRRNKGIHLTIEAVQNLRRRGREVELIIAGQPGSADAAYWQMCQSVIQAAPAGIWSVATFLSDAEMRTRLASCDAVVLPYDAFSAQSGVAIDAIASGRAIIATTAGGLGDLVEQSGGAIRIESASREAVEAAIETAIQLGRSGLAELGAAGASYARRQLSWTTVAEHHKTLYRKLTEAK